MKHLICLENCFITNRANEQWLEKMGLFKQIIELDAQCAYVHVCLKLQSVLSQPDLRTLSLHRGQDTTLNIVDEAKDWDVIRDGFAVLDDLHIFPDIFLCIITQTHEVKAINDVLALWSNLSSHFLVYSLVLKTHHTALCVVDDENLLSAKHALGDDQRAKCIDGHTTACVPDHMRVTNVEAHEGFRVDSGVHACDDG